MKTMVDTNTSNNTKSNNSIMDDNNQAYQEDTQTTTNETHTVQQRWLRGPLMCEICGRHKATVNLDLKYGSHKECRYCWDD